MNRIRLHSLKGWLNATAVFTLALLLLLPAGLGEAGAGEKHVTKVRHITLDQALGMAREAGPTLARVEIELGLAQSRLDSAKQSAGVGSYYDSRVMKRDMDLLEEHIEIKQDEINELDKLIKTWTEEQAGLDLELEGAAAEVSRLEGEISRAQQEKTVLGDDLLEIRRAYASMVPRYYQMKSLEDMVRPQLDPLELARDAAADEVVRQPDLLDYRVENLYLTILALGSRAAYQEMVLENQQRMLAREKVMVTLGMSTPLRLAQTETALEQLAEAGENLQAEQKSLKRDFAILLGMPLDSAYALLPVASDRLDVVEMQQSFVDAPPPDLTQSLSYLRALDVLQRRELDLDDTSKSDTKKYLEAELNVEKAQLDLEMALNSLRTAYRGAWERLVVTEKGLRNAALALQNEEKSFANGELQYSLGVISRMELEQRELALREAEIKQQEALNQHYLAYCAYLLARDGIRI